MIALDEYAEMKRVLDKARSEYQEMRGRRKHMMKELKERFEVDSIPEARKLLRKLERKERDAFSIWCKAKKRIKKKYPSLFGKAKPKYTKPDWATLRM